jgi:glycosyltransferase involved in cell wall biosynthesis
MKVTVITATYNSEKLIQRCIDSVHSQKVDAEHIIIDGLSNDSTNEIVRRNLRIQDKHVVESDDGIYDALNKGIAMASGEIIAILNSDDHFANQGVLSKIIASFEEGVDLVYAGTQYEDKLGKKGAVYIPQLFNGVGSFSRGWHPPHPSFYARKKCYDEAGSFRLDCPVAADFELMLRFFESHKFKARLLPEVVVRMDPGGFSSSWRNRFRGFQDIKLAFKENNCTPERFYFIKRYGKKFFERSVQKFMSND